MSYNRYKNFKSDGEFKNIPFVKIPTKDTDKIEVYKMGQSRLDNISYKYYKDPNYDWLIMLANPAVSSMEFEIPTGYVLRIPYPLDKSLTDYETALNNYNTLYGIE